MTTPSFLDPHAGLRRLGALLLATALAAGVVAPTAAAPVPPLAAPDAISAAFSDVGSSQFRAEIGWLVSEGIAAGCSETRFCPNRAVTRGELASFMTRALGLPSASRDAFTDDGTSIHEDAINRLAAAGLASGCGGGRYCPSSGVTRAQLASFFVRAFDLPHTTRDFFRDDTWSIHQRPINRATAAGVTAGCGSGRFCPAAVVTRGQFAAFLYRAMEDRLTQAAAGPANVVGLWVTYDEIKRQPTSGAAWSRIVDAAGRATGTADVSDQDSHHDQYTLAAAIYAVRTGQQRERAVAALTRAIGTEQGGRWLAVGRNLTGYIIAADLLAIRSGPIYNWLASFRTMRLEHNNSGEPITFRQSAWQSGSNASAQEGGAYAALGAYLGDTEMLKWSWTAFRRYAGDRSSAHRVSSNSEAWQQVPSDPVGIQNAGARRNGCSISGAISNDMSRGSDNVCRPGYTQYPWVGLEGSVPAAMILTRAGYPAFDIQKQALKRAAIYLMGLRRSTGESEWYDAERAAEIKHVLNRVYGLPYPVEYPVGAGRTVGFTDYTHR
ncbi:MAG TPA: S-layer homology domain-containing protein [Candidatus Limnocylindria bacterium]|nr:S-layer homology domain-containing protein [Candidatus Limnocylindria bacterium]